MATADGGGGTRWALGLAGVGVLAALGTVIWYQRGGGGTTPEATKPHDAAATVSGLPPVGPAVKLTPPDTLGVPALLVEVAEPAKIMAMLNHNAWLTSVTKAPLGRGFLGAWAALLQTDGEDLRASFKGTVGRFLAERLLDKATRLVWFAGDGMPSLPAVVVQDPTTAAKAAYAAMSEVAQRGALVSACPGATNLPDKGTKPQPVRTLNITRWVLAERTIFASSQDERMVLALTPDLVVQGLCAELPPPGASDDVAVTVQTQHMGRDAQLLATLLGVGDSARISFGLGPQDTLVPKGIAATLTAPAHLDKAPLSADLLKTIPEDAPVVVGLQLRLPQELTAASLKAHFAGQQSPTLSTRQVAMVWYPHGAEGHASDVALVWGTPSDRPALQAAFSGLNAMFWKDVCGNVVLASTAATAEHLARTCTGQDPSMHNSAGAVAQGLARPTSVAVGLHVGRLLAMLLRDAYSADNPGAAHPVPPPEVETAARQLLELPFFGLHGVLGGTALVPEGFRT